MNTKIYVHCYEKIERLFTFQKSELNNVPVYVDTFVPNGHFTFMLSLT